jgi:hypothetical protein
MKTRVLQFASTPRSHGTRAALSSAWIATGNPRQPLACVWIDREMRSFTAPGGPAGTRDSADTEAEDEVPLLHALCA